MLSEINVKICEEIYMFRSIESLSYLASLKDHLTMWKHKKKCQLSILENVWEASEFLDMVYPI